MNLILVPKYKKYNNQYHACYLASGPRLKRPQPKRMPNKGHVTIKNTITSLHSAKKHHIADEKTKKDKRKSKACKLCKWFEKKKALQDLKHDQLKDQRQLEHWEKWKKKEQRLIEQARLEKAREEREREYAQQWHDIHKARQKIAQDTLKTRYPYKVKDKKAAADIPLYTYDVDDEPSYKKEKSEKSKKQKKIPKSDIDSFDYYRSLYDSEDNEPKEKKWSKDKQKDYYDYYENLNESANTRRKEEDYSDYYKNLYDTDNTPVERYQYQATTTDVGKRKRPKKKKKVKEPKFKKEKKTKVRKLKKTKRDKELDYYDDDNYWSSSKKKGKKFKNMRTYEERPQLTITQKFVNCFYRTCCEFFCFLSLFLIIGFTIIVLV